MSRPAIGARNHRMDVGATNPNVLKLKIAHRGERFIIAIHFPRLGDAVSNGHQCMSDNFQDGSSRVTAFVVHERECLIHNFHSFAAPNIFSKVYVLVC